jgi:hypothetical protein
MRENATIDPRYHAWPHSYALYRAAKRARAQRWAEAIVLLAIRQIKAVAKALMSDAAATQVRFARANLIVR